MNETVKRYLFFLVGLFVNSIGVAFITLAGLGTSPISSVPYVLSLTFHPTLGQFTIVFNVFIVALQILVLKKDYQPIQLLQLVVCFLFGIFIDFSMDYLLFWLHPTNYFIKLISLFIGCIILAFGVFMEVAANTIMLPGEGLSNAIHLKTGKEFGTIKVCVDISMVVAALILSLCLVHGIQGIREGTIISALIVGNISKIFTRFLNPACQRMFTGKKASEMQDSSDEDDSIKNSETNAVVHS